jgi:hypothetical protein
VTPAIVDEEVIAANRAAQKHRQRVDAVNVPR